MKLSNLCIFVYKLTASNIHGTELTNRPHNLFIFFYAFLCLNFHFGGKLKLWSAAQT